MHHKFELSSILRTLLAFPRVPSFTYKSLPSSHDAIRLILLQPAPQLASPIRCQIIETSWGKERAGNSGHKGYVALSYTWGDPSNKPQIEIDGRPFRITKNLDLALRNLRQPRTSLRLWADSLCINQNDIEERNQHVAQMRDIYSAAQETTIFLGEATDGSNALLGAIQAATTQISQATTRSAVVKSLVDASGLRKSVLMEEAFKILWRPYWARIWIFQEIVVSNNPWVQCGSVKVPWEYFCQALIAIFDSQAQSKHFGAGYSNYPKRRLEDVYWERRAYRHAHDLTENAPRWKMLSGNEYEGRMKLLDLLVTKRGSQATDSRDMVFAVSGIAMKPRTWDPMSITYEKSPSRVFMSVVQYLLEHDKSYEVLSHAGETQQSSNSLTKMPSWAPDWRFPSAYKNKIVDWLGKSSVSKSKSVDNHVLLEDHGILACAGYQFDSIKSVGDVAQEIEPAPGSIGRVIWDNKWHRRTLIEHGILSVLGTRLGTVTNLVSRSHPLTYRRRLAKTKGGVLCLVPSDTQIGDLICQFIGSPIPYVLRPLTKEDWTPKFRHTAWSGIVEKCRAWIMWSPAPDLKADPVDIEILNALKRKDATNRNLQIRHSSLIGESFVDGLMQKDLHSEGTEMRTRERVAFALH